MPYRSNDEIMAEWRKVSVKTEEIARACMAAPHEAQLTYGVTPERTRPELKTFGGERFAQPTNEFAMWLRAAAKVHVPSRFDWEVHEIVGGHAALILKSYEDSDAFEDLPPAS